MPKIYQAQTSFTSGEITPIMGGRLDTTKYQNGVAKLENFIVRPHGGIQRRMGTIFVAEARSSDIRLIPFESSNNNTFLLEFGHLYVRVYQNDTLVQELVSPFSSASLQTLYYSQVADVMFFASKDYLPRRLSYNGTDFSFSLLPVEDGPYRVVRKEDSEVTFKLHQIKHSCTVTATSTTFGSGDVGKYIEFWKDGSLILGRITAYVSDTEVVVEPKENCVDGGSLDLNAVIEYDSDHSEVHASLAIWSSEVEYHYIKVAGVWYYMTTHRAYPREVGVSPNSVSMDVMNVDAAQTPTVIYPGTPFSYHDESITANLSTSTEVFQDTDIGRHFKMILGDRAVWGSIVQKIDPLLYSVVLGIMVPLDPRDGKVFKNNAETNNWRIGAWYPGNYPKCCTLHKGRLVFASTTLEPNRIWMSESENYISFAVANSYNEVLDSSAINIGIVSGEINSILWLQSGPVLLAGTQGEEFQVKSSSLGTPLTPTNITSSSQTPYGSTIGQRPIKIGASTLFLQRHGVVLRELVYSFEIDSFIAADTTITAEHIFRVNGRAEEFAYQQTPNSLLWFKCRDGRVVSMTYEKMQQVYAWANHYFGGPVVSLCTLSNEVEGYDSVYLAVKRNIGGVDRIYLERIAKDFEPESSFAYEGMVYVDCSSTQTFTVPVNTISGLGYLEGETVSVVVDGAQCKDQTVAGGSITVPVEGKYFVVGLPFTSEVRTLPQDVQLHAKTRRLVHVDLQILYSVGLTFYGESKTLKTVIKSFMDSSFTVGERPPLYTGIAQVDDESAFSKDCSFSILQRQAYPLTILSTLPTIQLNEYSGENS